jgi:hypothetical protein
MSPRITATPATASCGEPAHQLLAENVEREDGRYQIGLCDDAPGPFESRKHAADAARKEVLYVGAAYSEMRRPAARRSSRANSKTFSTEDHTTGTTKVQDRPNRLIGAVENSLILQISHLATRFALPKPTAVVVAELAFGEVTR